MSWLCAVGRLQQFKRFALFNQSFLKCKVNKRCVICMYIVVDVKCGHIFAVKYLQVIEGVTCH